MSDIPSRLSPPLRGEALATLFQSPPNNKTICQCMKCRTGEQAYNIVSTTTYYNHYYIYGFPPEVPQVRNYSTSTTTSQPSNTSVNPLWPRAPILIILVSLENGIEEIDPFCLGIVEVMTDCNTSDRAIKEILKYIGIYTGNPVPTIPSLYKIRKRMDQLSTESAVSLPCCRNSCIAFDVDHQSERTCPHCGENRGLSFRKVLSNGEIQLSEKNAQTYTYYEFIPKLQSLYQNQEWFDLI
ncbi:uncharacterized protein BJ171DRAFT_578349 [Polychytrium aggregatum]|uniref:uncharacterized protein n=1 Tax=Polychytrium aggregatum TaxID=110093 RepID=UPI0022FF182D|nr:uncharacterized protein BJ171DRAFT_578349 [Polychytrium aggregatum]KAI9207871.1 hypothetical protein BJ171DRAFT_578349 [Polychytrium aggregatum]